jgi:hypothetical protein
VKQGLDVSTIDGMWGRGPKPEEELDVGSHRKVADNVCVCLSRINTHAAEVVGPGAVQAMKFLDVQEVAKLALLKGLGFLVQGLGHSGFRDTALLDSFRFRDIALLDSSLTGSGK